MKKTLSIILCIVIVFTIFTNVYAVNRNDVSSMLNNTGNYIYKTITNPQVGSVGGEWAILGLSRSGLEIPHEYYEKYYENVVECVKSHNGVLDERKYTEYSRVILALTAIGKNPADVAGYNLLTPLGDYEKTIWQGINGPIWALIALDSRNYEIPQNPSAKTQATREMYINCILEKQLADGGWALSGNISDPDITGMVLQALAKYQDIENVKKATEKALIYISEAQNENGGFSSGNSENCESCVQIIVALCELRISLDDTRFTKNGNTVLDSLKKFYTDKGVFKHILESNVTNQMATEQGFYSIVAISRYIEGKNSLYNMSDAIIVTDNTIQKIGLANKNTNVQKMNITSPGKTFADIMEHQNQAEIEALASRNIINGKTDSSFEPNATMTRAEFAAIIARGLGLPQKNNAIFADVTQNDWYYNYINTAYYYGIVNGVSATEFNPGGTITREEAAVMVTRAAKLCGVDTNMESFNARDILAGFSDYIKATDWAVNSLAFCYENSIIPNDAMEIKPQEAVTRGDIAHMLYNMLEIAMLL